MRTKIIDSNSAFSGRRHISVGCQFPPQTALEVLNVLFFQRENGECLQKNVRTSDVSLVVSFGSSLKQMLKVKVEK